MEEPGTSENGQDPPTKTLNHPPYEVKLKKDVEGTTPPKEEKGEPPPCSVPTINFTDFVSLLSPSSVEHCLLCTTPLLHSRPPPLLEQRKGDVLKSFCDILNLPFNPPPPKHNSGGDLNTTLNATNTKMTKMGEDLDKDAEGDKEDEEDEGVDFPFCHQCTNKKVLMLTLVYQKLLVLQAQFDKLKESTMKDILRVFVTNIVKDKKIPLEVVRETKLCERMYHLFKGHSERRNKNTLDSEAQTDISSVTTPLLNPAAVALIMDGSGNGSSGIGNKRKRPPPRKSESLWNNNNKRTSSYSNLNSHSYQNQDLKFSPLKPSTLSTYTSTNIFNSPIKNTQIEETIVPFDDQLNGSMFSLDDHGILNDSYMPGGTDYSNSSYNNNYPKTQSPAVINGLTTIGDDFQSAISYADNVERSENMQIRARKSSPLTYINLDSASALKKSQRIEEKQRSKFTTCEVCGKQMLKVTLKTHMDQIHGGDKPWLCRGCDASFKRKDHFTFHEERHIINSKRYYFCHRCVESHQMISGKAAYVQHCTTAHGIEDDVVEFFHYCDADDCSESYKVREDFVNHVKTHWPLGECNKCETCDKLFSLKRRLVAHQEEAHRNGVAYYDCQFCYKGFVEENDFTRHMMFHKVKIPESYEHTCEICGKAFETLNRVRRHQYNTHVRGRQGRSHKRSTNMDDDDSMDEDSVIETPNFECEECGKSYKNEKKLHKHQQKHKSRKKQDPDDDATSSDDDIPDAGELDEDDEDYVEPSSKNKSKRKRRLSGRRSRSSAAKNQICPHCFQKFKASIELRRHLVNSHRPEYVSSGKAFCIVCFLIYDNQQILDAHYIEKHSQYKCQVCNKQTQNRQLLRVHMERHKKQAFTCSICASGFSSEPNLKKHVAKAHPQEAKNYDYSNSHSREEIEDDNSNNLSPSNTYLFNNEPSSYDTNVMNFYQL